MNILVLGDVMGPSGIKAVKNRLPKIIQEKNFLSVSGSHDGYQKKYGIIHEREIQIYPEINRLIGIGIIIVIAIIMIVA